MVRRVGIWTQSLWSQEPMKPWCLPRLLHCVETLSAYYQLACFRFRRQNLSSNELNDSGVGSVPWEEREISWGTEGGGLRHYMTWGFCLASASSYDGFFLSSWTASSSLLSLLPLAGAMRTMSPQTFVLLPPTSECFSSVSCSLKNSREETLLAWRRVRAPLQMSHLCLGRGITKYRHSHGSKGVSTMDWHLLQSMSSEPSLGFTSSTDWTESQMVAMGHLTHLQTLVNGLGLPTILQ